MPSRCLDSARRWFPRLPPVMTAALLLFLTAFAGAGAAEPEKLSATLLTRDLGDPRAPGNVKLVLSLPDSLADMAASARADDFIVHVHPAGIPAADGTNDRHRAGGIYLWRNGKRIFLDVRTVPEQERDGPAVVRVAYAPDGAVMAEGIAEGSSRYAAELADVVLAVDVSRSMNYNDPQKRRVIAARTFIDMARNGGGIGRVGLVTFNHRAQPNTPLLPLERGEEILSALDRVGADGFTSLDAPLALAMRQLAESGGSVRPVIILLTDGRNEGSRYADTHVRCAQSGIRLFTVGLTEQADHALLKRMADATGGIYFRAPKDSDLPEIYARLAAELGKRQLLHAELLKAPSGSIRLPIDATVRRLVAMADGGAGLRLDGPQGGGGMLSGEMAGAHVGSPVPGEWNFSWERATPNQSALALFGDTRFFLDVFPPQLRGEKLAVGATLAHGSRPLSGARAWMEPLPGILPERVELFDDGHHGDGRADDGVYGALADVAEGSPDRFDLTLRADGTAWDNGAFVRQTIGAAERSREPADGGSARLGGDIDFGVLFPGETGTAPARIELQSRTPRELYLDLTWDDTEDEWPDLRSSVLMKPGSRSLELEIMIPETAGPGRHRGKFSISDGGSLDDSSTATVRVGTVRLDNPGEIDLGIVPPGTFNMKRLAIPFQADKEAWLDLDLSGEPGVAVTPGISSLEAGRGEIPLEAVVSAPIGKAAGEYHALLTLRAGPGRVDIPLRWEVRPHTVAAQPIRPVDGLPEALETPAELPPLVRHAQEQTGDRSWTPAMTRPGPVPLDAPTAPSPWERAARTLRDGPPETVQALERPTEIPALAEPERASAASGDGDSLWSAWWLYLLAGLLLLLLLLLLLAYILYRLGKSSMVRFLLLSAVANIALLIAFIALLGASGFTARPVPPTITVNLVEDGAPESSELSEAEKEMLDAIGASGPAAEGGGASAAIEAAFDNSSAPAAGMVSEKTTELPDAARDGMELAEATRPAAVPLENRSREPLLRRERRTERASQPLPVPELPEMAEPPPESGERAEERRDMARMEMDPGLESDRPVWSDAARVTLPMALAEEQLLAEAPGMEAVSLEDSARRIDPRGRRRNRQTIPDAYPEPRAEIDDPVRDTAKTATENNSENLQADPGIEELRMEPRSMGSSQFGRRPGAVTPPTASRLDSERTETQPRDTSDTDRRDLAGIRGGPRTAREAASRGSPVGGLPGGANRREPGSPANGASGTARSGEPGERRYDMADGGVNGGTHGLPDSNGREPSTAARLGSGLAANPLPDGGGGERFGPQARFDRESVEGMPRGNQRRPDRIGSEGQPDNLALLPGGARDVPDAATGRAGRTGVGEGRFDDGGRASGDLGAARRSGPALSGSGISRLVASGPGDGLDGIPFESGGEWQRDRRRLRRRTINVAASAMDVNSLLLVVGDFARIADAASANLFAVLSERVPGGITVEERRLSPDDANLADSLLAVLSPEEARNWSDADIGRAGAYLAAGGHIWMDAGNAGQAEDFMMRLARAAGGDYGRLDSAHQLSDAETVDAITIGDKLAAVATYQDWRRGWRHGDRKNGRTLRFLIRSLNFFLSGDAETGIVVDDAGTGGDLDVQPYSDRIPELLAGGAGAPGRPWDDFGPETAQSWRMPGWSDPGSISAISDGQGGRALKLGAEAAVKGRTAVYRTLNPPEDFSRVNHLSLDVYYDGQGAASLSMVFTVPGTDGWADYETPPVELGRGWSRLAFPLRGTEFRVLTPGGGASAFLPGSERTGRAGFFLYRSDATAAAVLFRNIRLHE